MGVGPVSVFVKISHLKISHYCKNMIDTLAVARDLKAAGVKWEHAQAHAKAIADSTEKQQQDLATKDFVTSQIQTVRAEISDLRGDMNTQISDLRGDMNTQIGDLRGDVNTQIGTVRTEIKTLEVRLLRWMVVTFFSGMGLLFAALRLFPG